MISDIELVQLSRLKFKNKEIEIDKFDVFEKGLEKLSENLQPNFRLKCCYGCAFGDYSVYGQSFYGSMLCFRNIKAEYLKVKDKGEYMDIENKFDRVVQETYLCDEFLVREKGIGYRR